MPELGTITQETIDETKGILSKGVQQLRAPTSARKDITVAGDVLYGYPLEAPAKKLYPVEDSMRRRVPRWVNPVGGTYAHWKQITAINTNKVKAGVAEGAINDMIALADREMSARYVTLNMAGQYSDESRIMGRQFEDIPAYAMLSTLQSLMIQEDRYIIGGNVWKIGAPATVTATADAVTVGSLSAQRYYFKVSALTLHGYLNEVKGKANAQAVDVDDETDATMVTHASGDTPTSNTAITLTWTDVPGAAAYNIYAATTTSVKYLKTVLMNKATITDISGVGTTIPNAADATADLLGYNGLLGQIVGLYEDDGYEDVGSYYKSMDGAEMNGDNAAGVVEIDEALQQIWNKARISPTLFLVNAQESRSMKALAIGGASTNAARITVAMDGQAEFKAGAAVTAYYNPFTAQWIPILTSLHMAPGKILMLGERVPYPNSQTPNNFEVELQQEYYGEEFARTRRVQPLGVTCIGALKLYFPAACGVIANIKAST